MQRVAADAIIEALKPLSPASLKVYTVDGQERDVAVPAAKKRYRFAQVAKTLQGFDWYRIEALDARKMVIGCWENADREEEVGEVITERSGEQAALLSLMLKAQDVALRRHTEHTQQLLDSAVQLMQVYSERLVALEKLVHAQLDRRIGEAERGQAPGDGLEGALLAAVLSKGGAGEAEMEGMMERVASRVLPRVLSPSPANGSPSGGSSTGGTPGTGVSKPGK